MSRLVSTAALLLALTAVNYGQGLVGDNTPTATNQNVILITTIGGFLTLIATQIFAIWRESRNRKWDLADREAARREVRQHAETQRLETIQTAIDLAKVSNINRQHLVDHIEQNTAITKEAKKTAEAAYIAANNFNERLESLRKQLTDKAEQVDHIESVGVDTNQKVTDIKNKKEL
jgi:hypothetical protein